MSGLRVRLGIVLGWILIASHFCFAANPVWRWSNPIPHGAHIFALANNGSTIVQAGEFGQAFATDDLITWRPLTTGVTNMLRSAVWFDNRIVITGSEGLVLVSEGLNFFLKIDLDTSDWIEGVASSGTRLVAVGDNGAIYTSVNAVNWQKLPAVPTWLHSVAYGNGLFVAVGDAGFVMTSPDGLTWTTSPETLSANDLNRVTWSGNMFWVLGNAGTAYQSPTGSNWVKIDVGTTADLFSAACNGGQAVIVGRSELRTSSDPFTTWTSQIGESPAPAAWTYYSSLWDGAEFLVGGRSGMFVEGFKPPGALQYVWLSDSDSPRNWLWSLQRLDGLYVACGEHGGIFTSVEGLRFDQENVPVSVQGEILEGVGGTTNLLVSVGTGGAVIWSAGGHTNVVSTNSFGDLLTNEVSVLGLVWNESVRPTTNELQGVGVFGSTYIISGGMGSIFTSLDAKVWTPRVSGTSVMLSTIATSPTRAVIGGDFGAVLTSDDAILWTKRSSGITNWIYQIRYLNGRFIGVGEAGLILTSSDGLTWARQNSGTTRWLNGVNHVAGNYYIAASQGLVLRSPDAITWTALPQWTGKSLYDIAGEGGQLLTTGIEGAASRTRVTPWNVPVNFVSFDLSTNTQAFFVTGKPDQRFLIQRTADFQRWLDVAPAEILDPSGVTVFYDSILNGLRWFFRTTVIDP
jgi:hypothetical protein